MRSSSVLALVELVVAHAVDVEADLVHRLDRRLVVEQRRDSGLAPIRSPADDHEAVLAPLQPRTWVAKYSTPPARRVAAGGRGRWTLAGGGLELAVEVVEAEELDVHVFSALGLRLAPGTAMASAASANPRMRAPLRACEICMKL